MHLRFFQSYLSGISVVGTTSGICGFYCGFTLLDGLLQDLTQSCVQKSTQILPKSCKANAEVSFGKYYMAGNHNKLV